MMMCGELEHSSLLFGDFCLWWKMGKIVKIKGINLRNGVFLGYEWCDDFMMGNELELDWVWLGFVMERRFLVEEVTKIKGLK
jgi:hypothetical protein